MIFIIVIIIICCLFTPANESEPKNENTETNNVIIETQLPRSVIDATMTHQVIK